MQQTCAPLGRPHQTFATHPTDAAGPTTAKHKSNEPGPAAPSPQALTTDGTKKPASTPQLTGSCRYTQRGPARLTRGTPTATSTPACPGTHHSDPVAWKPPAPSTRAHSSPNAANSPAAATPGPPSPAHTTCPPDTTTAPMGPTSPRRNQAPMRNPDAQ